MRRGKSKRGVIAGLVVIVGTFGYLLYCGLVNNIVYVLTPRELLAKGAVGVDVPVRLGGQVKPGSVKWDDALLDLSFTVSDGEGNIPVHSRGAPPQMFRDGMGVVVVRPT